MLTWGGRESAPGLLPGPEHFLYGLVLRKEIGAASSLLGVRATGSPRNEDPAENPGFLPSKGAEGSSPRDAGTAPHKVFYVARRRDNPPGYPRDAASAQTRLEHDDCNLRLRVQGQNRSSDQIPGPANVTGASRMVSVMNRSQTTSKIPNLVKVTTLTRNGRMNPLLP